MRISLNPKESPKNILDIIPENDEDNRMIIEFLSNFSSRQDAARVVVSPMEGGIVVGVE